MDIISGKDTKFTDAVTLSFHGTDVAMIEQPFHKVVTVFDRLTIFRLSLCHRLPRFHSFAPLLLLMLKTFGAIQNISL